MVLVCGVHKSKQSGIHLHPFLLNPADVMYNGEMSEKIKLLYRLHIPPALTENDRDSQSPLKNPLLSTSRPLVLGRPNGEHAVTAS